MRFRRKHENGHVVVATEMWELRRRCGSCDGDVGAATEMWELRRSLYLYATLTVDADSHVTVTWSD